MSQPLYLAELCFLAATQIIGLTSLVMQRQHLGDCPHILNEVQLTEFKAFARLQMYLTLAYLVAMVPALVLLGRRIVFDHDMPLGLWLLSLALYGASWALGRLAKRTELKVRDASRCDATFLQAFEQVCYSWSKRMLPDF